MASSLSGSCARTAKLKATSAIAPIADVRILYLIISLLPVASIGQCQRGRSLDIAAETIRDDFDETNSSGGNFRHFAVVLPEVVPRLNLVHEAVLGEDQPIKAAAHLEGADHFQSVERKAFQKFAAAPRA